MHHLHRMGRMGLATVLGLMLGCSSAGDGPRLLEPIPAVGGGDAGGRRYTSEQRQAQCSQTGGSWQASGAFGEIGQY